MINYAKFLIKAVCLFFSFLLFIFVFYYYLEGSSFRILYYMAIENFVFSYEASYLLDLSHISTIKKINQLLPGLTKSYVFCREQARSGAALVGTEGVSTYCHYLSQIIPFVLVRSSTLVEFICLTLAYLASFIMSVFPNILIDSKKVAMFLQVTEPILLNLARITKK